MHIANHMAGSHSQAPLSKLMTHEFQHTVEKSYLERKHAHQHKILYFCITGGSIISQQNANLEYMHQNFKPFSTS